MATYASGVRAENWGSCWRFTVRCNGSVHEISKGKEGIVHKLPDRISYEDRKFSMGKMQKKACVAITFTDISCRFCFCVVSSKHFGACSLFATLIFWQAKSFLDNQRFRLCLVLWGEETEWESERARRRSDDQHQHYSLPLYLHFFLSSCSAIQALLSISHT